MSFGGGMFSSSIFLISVLLFSSTFCSISVPLFSRSEKCSTQQYIIFSFLLLLFMSLGWDCLWIAGSNGPIVHPPGYIWIWRATVEWCWQRKTEELREKPVLVPLCSITNPTGTDPGLCIILSLLIIKCPSSFLRNLFLVESLLSDFSLLNNTYDFDIQNWLVFVIIYHFPIFSFYFYTDYLQLHFFLYTLIH
jgi:hypothetical protein